ncbi:Pyocin large subunit [Enterobacter cloacae]|uniref:PAAR domain-containing protein n=1 Tax=Enterobacter cloacae TaxID=550 RepID=UPI000796D941|nr:PAAR domain-containing protein [Enterobacter cloacae]SAE77040.1 Pyocin large subunit [Enterobacter cloacae]
MSVGYFLRVGDSTTCGGKILTGDPTFQWYGVSAAREGDMVNCGKHPGTYKILGGAADTFDGGQVLAGSLDSFSSCPCHAKFIPGIPDSYSRDDAGGLEKTISTVTEANSVVDNLWISFALPKTENYSGLNYRLTMDDGSVHKGMFDENNKVYIPSVSARSCISVEIESPGNDNSVCESLTSQLLKNIMG